MPEVREVFWRRLYVSRSQGNRVAHVFDVTNRALLTGSRDDWLCRSTPSYTANCDQAFVGGDMRCQEQEIREPVEALLELVAEYFPNRQCRLLGSTYSLAWIQEDLGCLSTLLFARWRVRRLHDWW